MRFLLRFLMLSCLLAALAACAPPAAAKLDLKGTDMSETQLGGDFSLTDHLGKPRKLSDFSGKVVALFFGYTHCPDVCPTTMLEYATVMKKLGADADKVQVLFVTVDPERDTTRCWPAMCHTLTPFCRPDRQRGAARHRSRPPTRWWRRRWAIPGLTRGPQCRLLSVR
jgi:cytochrome oxidase Cu insertion factor (SCO1/SenC/PrrC family)